MDKPVVYDTMPYAYDLEAGKKYHFCTCGRASKGAMCDGSHAVTDLKPLTFVAQKTATQDICLCKHTKNPPYCDGSHAQFDDDDIGKEGPGV